MAYEKCITHGMSRTRLYSIWQGMRVRTGNKKGAHGTSLKYIERGIALCEEWKTFEPFRDWALSHGYTDDLQIDRIDNNGDYTPDNCRFVTCRENLANRDLTHKYSYTLTPYIDIVLGIKWNSDQTELESVDMSNTWYWSRVITQADAERLDTLGLWYNSGYKHGSMLYWRSGMPYNLSLIDVYTDIGETPAPGALSAFSLYQAQFNVLALRCDQTYQTLVKTYKVRITWRL